MSTMTITIERTPRTLQFAGQSLQVEELSIRLPFARKPADLGELGGRDQHKVYVTETKELTPAEFDAFGRSLLLSRAMSSSSSPTPAKLPPLPPKIANTSTASPRWDSAPTPTRRRCCK